MKSPPENENAASAGDALKTDYATQNIPPGGLERKEAADLFRVHVKTVDRWRRRGKLIISLTPGGRPRIHGVKP